MFQEVKFILIFGKNKYRKHNHKTDFSVIFKSRNVFYLTPYCLFIFINQHQQ